ncbi:AAA family ATPase [Candidatus Uhrbacteria bacterium RIFCSPHIGHO2_12_FULL_54_23]|uniref:AAA family ATPase n=3 Tax=Candidatus Uhriibacteriota TaxID=1752732 RepID=A0A1F7UP14_9BACT|nr:MAG: AAA family ATPase [Candidatus Uhrbacteria bacterium RIFCSPHIGHO2_12_FULL_54_23]OGL83860.1 MAG: AAA family ATPase [Candidatus Uhrbacteria bacterium RIFCSPLOWO2_01_FULL_55_36]OGL91082.1 MAG: AAA family ATPase [Candidatus Uhrbacteria bacterium RIFCSPLOWO2_02_FULL_54_37]
MRPERLEEFFGQEELLGEGTFLRRAIEEDRVPSMILWGPPGCGKTTLASVIARQTKSEFIPLSATASGVEELRKIIDRAESGARLGVKTVLFIDEIHRWNKAQQDRLLPNVEKGVITLIGATTENPSFEVNSALLSRARVFVLKLLDEEALMRILKRAVNGANYELGIKNDEIQEDALHFIATQAHGDARFALNTLEAAASQDKKITIEVVKQILQKSHLLYDKKGEEHYNIISALHKSMRGGDANAAVYWLARMLECGEDPLYVARRIVRFASEDIGLANNTALLIANAAFEASHKLGMPECAVHLAHAVIYMALSKKSVAAYDAYSQAKKDVEEYGHVPVPLHLRNAPTQLMKDLQYGKGYTYTPKQDSGNQTYLPEELKGRKYYQ